MLTHFIYAHVRQNYLNGGFMLNEKIIQQFIKQAFLDGCEYGNSASVNDDEAAERYATETISAVKDYLTTKKEV